MGRLASEKLFQSDWPKYMNSLISLGVDLGRSSKSAFCVIEGFGWQKLKMVHLEALSSISAPEVEKITNELCYRFGVNLAVVESNGPGGVFAEFAMLHNPQLPLFSVDVGEPPIPLQLWDDLRMDEREYYNIRAENYFIVRHLFRAGKLKLAFEDTELFAQLTATYWDTDKTRSDKIKLMPKKNMRMSDFASELEGVQFSRSPDKADALALACLGYAILMQDELASQQGGQMDEIMQPTVEGYFDIGRAGIDEMYE